MTFEIIQLKGDNKQRIQEISLNPYPITRDLLISDWPD